jgi:hypothetical protein
MIFSIIDDTIELDGLPVATIHPSVWPTRRDYLEQTLESYEPKTESELRDERDELKARIDELTTENIGLKNRVDDLEVELESALEHDQ